MREHRVVQFFSLPRPLARHPVIWAAIGVLGLVFFRRGLEMGSVPSPTGVNGSVIGLVILGATSSLYALMVILGNGRSAWSMICAGVMALAWGACGIIFLAGAFDADAEAFERPVYAITGMAFAGIAATAFASRFGRFLVDKSDRLVK